MNQNRFLSILVLMFLCFGIGMFAQLWAAVPNAVSNPYPADGAIDVPSTLRLTWDHVKGAGGAPTGYRVSLREAPLNPNGFTFKFEMYGIRYYLSNAPATWEVARQESWSYGGYLTSSFSAQMNTLFQTHAPEGQNVFIGLSDHIEEGVYKWQDGRTFGYANWDSNEPNNGGGSNEDAVELRKSNGKWNDISVTASRYYFMQIPGKVINNEITATAYYDFNHVVSFNRVFYWDVTPFNADGDGPTSSFSFRVRNSGTIPAATTVVGPTGGSNVLNPTLSWNSAANAEYYKLYLWKARGNPDAYGNSLIGVYNGHAYYKSNDLVTWETAKANCESWGAHLMTINSQDENDIAPGDFSYWIGMHDTATEGDIHWVTGEQIKYTNWGTDEPNNDTEDYMHVRTDKKWNDNTASATMRYLVEYPGTILDGKVVTGTSYSLKDANLEPNSSYCWIAIPYSTSGRPWVTGWWQFSTGGGGAAPGTISTISPLNGSTGVAINTDLTWTAPSGDPTEYYAYFGTNNTIDNAANYTDLGFWNGHHYYRYDLETLPWCSAEAKAKLDGGYLATIGSANENTKLAEPGFGNEYTRWFGGNDRMIANVWKHSNGDPWAYTNWLTGEPNNGGGAQYYTAINWGEPGKWDDQSNTHSRYFLLETVPNIADGTRLLTNSYTPSLLRFNTTYYWSAVGSNAYGMANDTQRWSFTTTNGKAVNPIPHDTATDIITNFFDWDPVGGASNYLFYLGTSNGNWNLINGASCPTNTYTYVGDWDDGTTYYWKVATVTPLETVQGNTWTFVSKETTLYDVLITSAPTGASISTFAKFPEANITPKTYQLLAGSSAQYNVSMDDYTWQVDPLHDSNMVVDIQENKHIHFIGTYHLIDAGTGFEYIGAPGVSVQGTPSTLIEIAAPAPSNINNAGSVVVMKFTGSTESDLRVVVPEGTWYVIAYYGGEWHHANPYPSTHPDVAVFANVPFGAKDNIPVIITSEDATLPLVLASFTATQTSTNQAWIKWTVGSETSMLGYHIYAGTSNQLSSAECMSSNYIPAQNNSSTTSYSFVATDITEYGTYYFWLEAIPQGGNSDFYGPITLNFNEPTTPQFPDRTELFNAYPNPFYNSTTLRADLKAGEKGKVAIYNVSGQLVKTYSVTQGTNTLLWDGRDTRGKDCPNGIYFYKLDTPSQHQVKKLIIAK